MKTAVVLFSCSALLNIATADVATAPHAKVEYKDLDAPIAQALAETLSAAWTVYTADFGFALPETIRFEATCAAGESTKLYTDGNDRFYLTIPNVKKLDKPAADALNELRR